MIRIISPQDLTPELNKLAINATIHSNNWSRGLSPGLIGPVHLPNGYTSYNLTNAVSFSGIYKQHLGVLNLPIEEYLIWAENGWKSSIPSQYPMGESTKPEFIYWDGRRFTEQAFKEQIFIPLYCRLVKRTDAYAMLVRDYLKNFKEITIYDTDSYDYTQLGMTYQDVIKNNDKKMGHSFLLAMLLEGILD